MMVSASTVGCERICFIVPPSVFLLDERVFMTLGILRVAAVVERAGNPVDMLDLSGIENHLDAVVDYIESHATSTFCLTATTPQMPAVSEVARVIRERRPHARIVLGGPHVTLVNAAYRQEAKRGALGRANRALMSLSRAFDILVAGDGEDAIFVALKPQAPAIVDA